MRVRPLLITCFLPIIGCAGRKPFLAPDFYAKSSPRVAVLPFENQSVDLLAPDFLQGLVIGGIRHRGYNPIAANVVQQKLKDVGITDGGQLPSITPQKLGETLQVDGLFYGTIEDFVFQNLGFILRRAVKLRLKLVVASTGETLWEDLGENTTMNFALNQKDAERLFAIGMAEKAALNMAKRPLWLQSQIAVQQLMMKLPNPNPRPMFGPGPFLPPPTPPPLPNFPPGHPPTPAPPPGQPPIGPVPPLPPGSSP